MLWWISPAAAYVLIGVAMLFYLTLSFTIAVGMLALAALMVFPLTRLGDATLPVAIAVFVVAWVGQFAGHRIEGKKPSFVEDVRFLLVGPAWLLGDFYRRLGIPY
jgi:uncharacterized membrane protein YGL010W